MINKELVKRRFERSLSDYNSNAKIQKQMAEKLFSFLDNKNQYENVLEIGCGTGLLTEIISQNVNYKNYDCLDIVQECESFISRIDKKINFISDDIENYIDQTYKQYDLIVSNASLQWVENFDILCKKIISHLAPKGIFLFSTFGEENYREIRFASEKSLIYTSVSELNEIFSNLSPLIEEEIRIMYFKKPTDVLQHLRHTGVNGIESVMWTKKDLINFENSYNNFCSGHPTLTYNPIYVLIKN